MPSKVKKDFIQRIYQGAVGPSRY